MINADAEFFALLVSSSDSRKELLRCHRGSTAERIVLGVHPFPLIRGGGLFLLLVGLAIMVGAVAPRRLWASFIAGVIIASAVVALTAIRLAAPLGKPTPFQLDSLMVAVFIEVMAIGWLGSRLRAATERQRICRFWS